MKSHYCGPAVGQVIANYAWADGGRREQVHADDDRAWMKTDVNGLTNAPELAAGLRPATPADPARRRSGRGRVTDLRDRDGSGSTVDELQDFLVTAISRLEDAAGLRGEAA